jgi:CRP-like cAMP-binding protein
MIQHDTRSLLKTVSIFSELDARELDALLQITVTKTLRADEVFFRKGSEGTNAFIVTRGRLKITTSGEDGREFVLQIIGPGDVLGELALLDRSPRSATVVAVEPSELLVIQRRDFLPFLKRHPAVAVKLLEELGGRVRRLSDLLEDTVFLGLGARLAKKLLVLAVSFGREVQNGIRVDLKLSQQELGEMVGMTRESINKQIRSWTKEGVLSMQKGFITIHKEEVLEDLARLTI